MQKGDKVWFVSERPNGITRTAATLHSISPQRVKIRLDGQGISSFVFKRNVPDSFPMYEFASHSKRNKRIPFRLEARNEA